MFSGDGAGWIVPDGVVSIIRREFPTENDGWKSARGSQFLGLKPGMDPAGTKRLSPRGFKFCEPRSATRFDEFDSSDRFVVGSIKSLQRTPELCSRFNLDVFGPASQSSIVRQTKCDQGTSNGAKGNMPAPSKTAIQ